VDVPAGQWRSDHHYDHHHDSGPDLLHLNHDVDVDVRTGHVDHDFDQHVDFDDDHHNHRPDVHFGTGRHTLIRRPTGRSRKGAETGPLETEHRRLRLVSATHPGV
jgi:hypothetical protein